MIVKNESKIIERCLNSAKSIIDYVSICDTGSTDQTPEIIETWCKENNIPGTVHHEPFKNFGYNRTLAVSLAQQTYSQADYLLMLDADMVLEVGADFDKTTLDMDQYLTMQYNGRLKFWLTRLLKASLPWHSVGVTHEYWDIDHSKLGITHHSFFETKGKLNTLVVDDQEDGGSRTDKFERDKRLLLEGFNDSSTPNDLKIRYMFYLGQTCMCLGEYEESIEWYKKRVNAGGWEEEVYFSMLQIGLCFEQLAQISVDENKQTQTSSREAPLGFLELEESYLALALMYFEKAYEYRPTRAESLYHLARIHRIRSNNYLGFMYALQGKEIPFPKEDILFVNYHVYDYLFDYEISICANYIPSKLEVGREAQKRLESMIDQLPPHIARSVENNSRFY